MQVMCAAVDSLGLCVFGRSVTNEHPEMIINAVNAAFDAGLDMEFFEELGRETIRMEKSFNTAAGFNEEDDELPEFFYSEPLTPSGKTARHRSADVNRVIREALG